MLAVQTGSSFTFSHIANLSHTFVLPHIPQPSVTQLRQTANFTASGFHPAKTSVCFTKPIIACMLLGVCCNCLFIMCGLTPKLHSPNGMDAT